MEGVSSHACAESLQGVSPSKDLFPLPEVARGYGPKMRTGCFPSLILIQTTLSLEFGEKLTQVVAPVSASAICIQGPGIGTSASDSDAFF